MEPREHPLSQVMYLTLIDVICACDPQDAEVWLNPGDWEDIGRPSAYAGMPVRTSLGVPAGTVRFFDRVTLRYLPEAGQR